MRESVRKRLVEVINRNCHWLKAVAHEEPDSPRCKYLTDEVNPDPGYIVLRVIFRHKGYRKGMVITITASSICRALTELSVDRHFAARVSHDSLTVSDVERILVCATNGVLDPDLYDY